MSTHTERRPVFWTALLRGVVAALFGMIALFWPGITVLAFVVAFGTFAIVDGFMSLGGAFAARDQPGSTRALFGTMGALGVLVGLAAFVWPSATAIVLAWMIAFWAVATGVLEVAAAFAAKNWTGHFGWLSLISGALSVILGLLIAVQPGAGAITLAWMIGALALVWGIVLILAGFGARGASQNIGRGVPGGGSTATGG